MEGTDKIRLVEMLTCPVCQDIFRNPCLLPCGHSMCMTCLESMVDHTIGNPFRCPDCRGYFGNVVGVQKCYALAGIAEYLRENQPTESATISRRQLNGANTSDSHSSNSMTVVLLCLWFIALSYAYSYSVENQKLTMALGEQQRPVHHIYSNSTEKPMLDVETASPFLELSPDLRTAERVKNKLPYPRSLSRFEDAPQVLSTLCFSRGTHTWEVEALGYWDISVSYKSIARKSKQSAFGNNAESWSLMHNGRGKLFAYHDEVKTVVPDALQSSRIAVTVSFKKGRITFSSVKSTVTKLHEFKAQLTKAVCLGLGLYRVDPPSRASIVKAS